MAGVSRDGVDRARGWGFRPRARPDGRVGTMVAAAKTGRGALEIELEAKAKFAKRERPSHGRMGPLLGRITALALASNRRGGGLALVYAGASLVLEIAQTAGRIERVTLGTDLAGGERPQAVVRAHAWQAAHTLGDWTLVSCTVAPGFDFAGFELASKGWEPRHSRADF